MFQPLINLFRSRTFVSALVGAIFSVFVTQNPALQPYADLLVPTIVGLVLMIAGGEVVETASRAQVEAEKERTAQAQLSVEQARIMRGGG